MKLIDLFNKIANKEEVPKRIKVGGREFYICHQDTYYNDYDYQEKDGTCLIDYLNEYNFVSGYLNKEVEIIEDKEKEEMDFDYIEELELKFGGDCKYRIHAPNGVSYETAGEVGNAVNKLIKNQRKLIKAVNELKKGK